MIHDTTEMISYFKVSMKYDLANGEKIHLLDQVHSTFLSLKHAFTIDFLLFLLIPYLLPPILSLFDFCLSFSNFNPSHPSLPNLHVLFLTSFRVIKHWFPSLNISLKSLGISSKNIRLIRS